MSINHQTKPQENIFISFPITQQSSQFKTQ
jgi:hypothetical protein